MHDFQPIVKSYIYENVPQIVHFLEIRHPCQCTSFDVAVHINHGYASWCGSSALLLANGIAKTLFNSDLSFIITMHDAAGHGFTRLFPDQSQKSESHKRSQYATYITQAVSLETSASSGVKIFQRFASKTRIIIGFSMGATVSCLMALACPASLLVLLAPAIFCDTQGPITESLAHDPRAFVLASTSNVVSLVGAVLLMRSSRDLASMVFQTFVFPYCATRLALWYALIRMNSSCPGEINISQLKIHIFPILYRGVNAAHHMMLFNRYVCGLFETELLMLKPIAQSITHSIDAIGVRTLIIHGNNDDVIPFNNSELLRNQIRNSSLVPIADCTHSIESNIDEIVQCIFDESCCRNYIKP
jgi:pimeloyl-ACP methyl ester carboxylesterase